MFFFIIKFVYLLIIFVFFSHGHDAHLSTITRIYRNIIPQPNQKFASFHAQQKTGMSVKYNELNDTRQSTSSEYHNGLKSLNFHELNGGQPSVLSGKRNDVTSVRYYEMNGGKPLSIDFYAKSKPKPQNQAITQYIHVDPGPSYQGNNIEQTIDYPTSVIESNEIWNFQIESATQTTDVKTTSLEPIEAVVIDTDVTEVKKTSFEPIDAVILDEEHVKPVVKFQTTTQTVSVDTQATQTFQAETHSTQTPHVEAQATQTIQEKIPDILIEPPTPKPEVKEVEIQKTFTYPPEVKQEVEPYPITYSPEDWLEWESYYYGNIAPYMYPPQPIFLDDDYYLSDEPKKKNKYKTKKRKSKTIETQTTISKEEDKGKEITKVIEKQVIIVPDVRYASEYVQKEDKKDTKENKAEVFKENKYKDYFGNFSNNHMSVMQYSGDKRKSVPNGGGRRKSNQSNRAKSSSGFKKGNVLISEKDLVRIWNSRNNHKKHVGETGSIKLELPPDYLNRTRFDDDVNADNSFQRNNDANRSLSQTDNRSHRDSYTHLLRSSEMAQNIPPADYDMGYEQNNSNDSGVLQRYLRDVSNNADSSRNMSSQENRYSFRKSFGSRQYGESNKSGYVSHVGSYRPEADTFMHRNETLQPQVVEILPDDVPVRPDEIRTSVKLPQ